MKSKTQKRKAKPYTSLFDERTGQWTNVEFYDDRLVFVKTEPKSHWVAKLLGASICLMLFITLIQSPIGFLFLGGFIALAVWDFVAKKLWKSKSPIVISKKPLGESEVDSTFHVNNVRRFLVRENEDRNQSEDNHLLQIYMEIRNEDCLVLLYQDYFEATRNESTTEIFEKMNSWLKN